MSDIIYSLNDKIAKFKILVSNEDCTNFNCCYVDMFKTNDDITRFIKCYALDEKRDNKQIAAIFVDNYKLLSSLLTLAIDVNKNINIEYATMPKYARDRSFKMELHPEIFEYNGYRFISKMSVKIVKSKNHKVSSILEYTDIYNVPSKEVGEDDQHYIFKLLSNQALYSNRLLKDIDSLTEEFYNNISLRHSMKNEAQHEE